jgi:peptide/nickel transport system ATP-binding protein
MVLNQGKEVDQGILHEVIANPRDEYTRLLLNSIPNPFADFDAPTVLDKG